MKVSLFQRRTNAHQFSIEKVFEGIQQALSATGIVDVDRKIMPHYSQGVMQRLKNLLWSRKQQGDVNHISGDVHYIAMGLDKNKTILTIHDLNFLNHPHAIARWILKMFWLTLPLKNVAMVTVISEATKRDLRAHIKFPAKRIRIIPNYYTPTIQPSAKEFNHVKPTILQIGTKANKNISRLIEALKDVACHLVIIGGDQPILRRQLESQKQSFTWLQNLSDKELVEQYVQCDVLSFISTIEGFGLPIVEAQAVGRVVVTSNISSMPEVAGDGACLVNPFDVASIRQGMLRVVEDAGYREQLIRNGFNNIRRFELSSVTQQYLNLYEEVLVSHTSKV